MIETMPRTEVTALCRRLGHDPSRVTSITLDPHNVTVTYVHPITDETRVIVQGIPNDDEAGGES